MITVIQSYDIEIMWFDLDKTYAVAYCTYGRHFKFLGNCAEIFASLCFSLVSTTLAISYLPVQHQQKFISAVALLPAMKQLQTISDFLHLKTKLSKKTFYECKHQPNSISKKHEKNFLFQTFFFYSRCHWHWWSTFTDEYLIKFL